jgi:ribonucleoside-diphosphate reductase alpha chain
MVEVRLTDNALKVLQARYLRRDPEGQLVETPEGLFRRVAHAIAQPEADFGTPALAGEWEEAYLDALARLDFLPNSPTLMNAGTPLGQLSACFVLPVEDSMEEIFESLKLMALIQQSGGGTGFSFSRLRPRGDRVASTCGAASGPVSFMRIFDCATENIKQGGKRRGANMGVLRVDHPDVEEFVAAKLDGQGFRNFNLSVAVTGPFMEAAAAGQPWTLRHPGTGRPAGSVPAAELFSRIARAAWQTGDPGLIFLDTINRDNPTPELGAIEATNPCGELPLLPYESCNLGSVNLSHMTRREGAGHAVDWDKLGRTARLGVRFLDDVIEVSRWPAPAITAATRGNRKVGLGVMGFAELLLLLGVPYASGRALALADELMRFLLEIAPEDHLRVQAAFQKHTDSAVSKTINLPQTATAEEVGAIYRRAWEWGLKGITVFRYGSKGQQVLQLGVGETPEEHEYFARCDPEACKL